MAIIAERGLFVRLLVQSGQFATSDAEVLADALDAATREPATRAELNGLEASLKASIAELKAEFARFSQRMDAMEKRLDARIDALGNRLVVRLGGIMAVLLGLFSAALRLT